jgi:thioredoxin-dependent peroxiredoxin
MIFSRLFVVVCISSTEAFSPAAIKSRAKATSASSWSSLAVYTTSSDDDNNSDGGDTSTQAAGLSRRGFVSSVVATAAAGATVLTASNLPIAKTATTAWAAADLDPKTSFSTPETGRKAPDFELPSSRGSGTTSLSELTKAGKWTVLYFYPGAFSTGCTLEAKSFQRDIEEYRKSNAQIVGVSVDPPEKNEAFCSATGLDFYMLSDVGGKVSTEYGSAVRIPGFGTFSNRQTYLIDPQGKLQWVFTGVENRIPTHSKEVLAKLEEIQSGQVS